MKIIKLEAENVMRLHAVEIEPDGNVVVIAGKNGAGKSSILNSVFLALGGGAAQREIERPLRDGTAKGSVSIDLGDLVVTRTFTPDGKTTLKVTTAEGASYSSPQKMLDDLVGKLSFDPLDFASQDAKSQLATLLALVTLPFDPGELDAQRQSVYDERTNVNRDLKSLQARLAAMPHPPHGLPDDEVSAADLLTEIQAAQAVVDSHKEARASARVVAADADIAKVAAVDARDRLEQARADLHAAEEALETAEVSEKVAASNAKAAADIVELLEEDPDIASMTAHVGTVEETNRQVREAKARAALETEVVEVELASKALTAKIELIDDAKTIGMKEAVMPLDGLGFDDTGVTYQGVPFKQCSSAEQLRVSVAMAMAMNPDLRVILIRDGSLLDSDNMAVIAEMAGEKDFQIWLEKVAEAAEIGIFIEDGSVVAVDGVEVEA